MGHREQGASRRTLHGIGVGNGRAHGPVVAMPPPVTEPEVDAMIDDANIERALSDLDAAAGQVHDDLERRAGRIRAAGRTDAAELLETTALMAVDPTLLDAARSRVRSRASPARAVWDASATVAAALEAAGEYMAGRVRDVADV